MTSPTTIESLKAMALPDFLANYNHEEEEQRELAQQKLDEFLTNQIAMRPGMSGSENFLDLQAAPNLIPPKSFARFLQLIVDRKSDPTHPDLLTIVGDLPTIKSGWLRQSSPNVLGKLEAITFILPDQDPQGPQKGFSVKFTKKDGRPLFSQSGMEPNDQATNTEKLRGVTKFLLINPENVSLTHFSFFSLNQLPLPSEYQS